MATSSGGAVFNGDDGTLTLDSRNGDIVFRNNSAASVAAGHDIIILEQ